MMIINHTLLIMVMIRIGKFECPEERRRSQKWCDPGMPFHPLHEAGLASGPYKGDNFHQKAEPVEQNLSEREEMKLYMTWNRDANT